MLYARPTSNYSSALLLRPVILHLPPFVVRLPWWLAAAVRGSGSASATGTGNLNVTSSAAPQAGDLIHLIVNCNNSSSGVHPTPASTGFGNAQTSTASVWSRLTCLQKANATGSEGTTFTVSGFAGADAKAIGVIVFSGVETTVPTNFVTTPDSTSNTTLTIPAITMAAANSMDVVYACLGGNNPGAVSNFSTWGNSLAEFIDIAQDSGGGSYYAGVAAANVLRAASGLQAATTAAVGFSDVNGVIRVEVKEAVAAGKALPPRRQPYRFFTRRG